jgi:hypothetical protein
MTERRASRKRLALVTVVALAAGVAAAVAIAFTTDPNVDAVTVEPSSLGLALDGQPVGVDRDRTFHLPALSSAMLPVVVGRKVLLSAEVRAKSDARGGAFQRCMVENGAPAVSLDANGQVVEPSAGVITTWDDPGQRVLGLCRAHLLANQEYEDSAEYRIARLARGALEAEIASCLGKKSVASGGVPQDVAFDGCVASAKARLGM